MTTNDQTVQTADTVLCEKCKQPVGRAALLDAMYICPLCGKYNRLPARTRIEFLVDRDTFKEHNAALVGNDPIAFPGYDEKLRVAREKSGEVEGVICGEAKIDGQKCCLFVMEGAFMMGSMGTALGDKVAQLFEYATEKRLPVVGYTVSGGARMQEGMLSLIQMAKTSGAVKKHSDAGLFYIVCNTDPTTGGVTASFAMLGDVIIAEPGATIGFAGRRVIEQVMGEKLPPEFQSAEFQLKNGFVDAIVPREKQREYVARMLRLHAER